MAGRKNSEGKGEIFGRREGEKGLAGRVPFDVLILFSGGPHSTLLLEKGKDA